MSLRLSPSEMESGASIARGLARPKREGKMDTPVLSVLLRNNLSAALRNSSRYCEPCSTRPPSSTQWSSIPPSHSPPCHEWQESQSGDPTPSPERPNSRGREAASVVRQSAHRTPAPQRPPPAAACTTRQGSVTIV